ncbi:hypothetical protein RFI_18234 [Reticulomyxa filosa]|uniref:glycine hydroxymethyltransferase n=1 Tax=Reticulomyxa filosa TaxID=46433 RepID=X6MYX3_RETFI|nr:hypothetical protein RFI_18234 [Reticulomyxa filosa]|eukprot:ETO19006.1 hypothetical protein RFI_18234 [Reticulomyxa filosa]
MYILFFFSFSFFRKCYCCVDRAPRSKGKATSRRPKNKKGKASLKDVDPEIFELIKEEEKRQRCGLELIASEVIDKLEVLCQERALKVFNLDPKEWAVNVQPYSGSTANFAAMNGLLNVGDRFMGLHLPDGGHLSHGFYRPEKAVNISAKYFTSLPYYIDPSTGYIDYDDLEKQALRFCPKLIIGGSSAYPRDWDYKRLREIADKTKAILLIDMAHFSGLVAAKIINNPFEFADVVTTTTHKSLRATRAALIFCRTKYAKDINYSVFPGTQGGPHNHAIAGIAVALREALAPEFTEYAKQIVLNCRTLANELKTMGHKIATGGTDTHLLLWDLRPHVMCLMGPKKNILKMPNETIILHKIMLTSNFFYDGLTGAKVEYVCDLTAITINKNTVHGDKSALNPGGVRVGTPALTSRGFKEEDFKVVAKLLDEVCQLSIAIQQEAGSTKHSDFTAIADKSEKVKDLKRRVEEFAEKFPIPGRILE